MIFDFLENETKHFKHTYIHICQWMHEEVCVCMCAHVSEILQYIFQSMAQEEINTIWRQINLAAYFLAKHIIGSLQREMMKTTSDQRL